MYFIEDYHIQLAAGHSEAGLIDIDTYLYKCNIVLLRTELNKAR